MPLLPLSNYQGYMPFRLQDFREVCYWEMKDLRRDLLGKMGEVYVVEIEEVSFSQKKDGMATYRSPVNYLAIIG